MKVRNYNVEDYIEKVDKDILFLIPQKNIEDEENENEKIKTEKRLNSHFNWLRDNEKLKRTIREKKSENIKVFLNNKISNYFMLKVENEF